MGESAPAPGAEEPRLDAFRARAEAAAERTKHHRPTAKAAANAQAASAPNADADIDRQAAEQQIDAMGAAEPGRFDPAAFKDALQKAIDGMAPPATEQEAEDVEKATDPGPARDEIHAVVTGGRTAAEGDIKATTYAPLDRSGKKAKKPDKLVNDVRDPTLPPVKAADAMPAPKPEAATDFSTATGEIDGKIRENGLTQDQLATSNEPSFTAVLDARDAARANAASAPAEYRVHEQAVLATARGDADAAAAPSLAGMHGRRAAALSRVLDVKHGTSDSDARQRDTVNQAILDIHKRTRDDVHGMLDALDTKVDKLFTAYEESARADFEADVGLKMQNYKDKRYSGLSGLYHGARDYFKGLPKEVDTFYREGRAKYLREMERALEKLANLIVSGLFAAHVRILVGRAQVNTYVEKTLPQSLRKLGRETAETLDHDFDTLESDIDSKRDELVQKIARKYVDAQTALDSRIEELKAQNRGLIDKAIDATIGVAKTIYELGKMLLRVLIRAAEAVGDIVAHPIRFLGNLIDAVGGGLNRFVDRIGVHLQEALVDLLFGELGRAGITMPVRLDFAGIVDLVLQVLGLTYGRIRERAVRRFGEPVVSRLERTVDIFMTLAREGIAGLWAQIKEKLSDLEDLVIGKIKDYVIERVVTAGVNYILALLTPVGAFIKACQTIYRIVMFIVEKAKEIAAFVDSVLDSISAIAAGDVTAAVLKVESALAGALKIAVKFLAELLNLGSLAEKVRSIIDLIRAPITKIVDAIVFGAAELFRRTVAFVRGKPEPREDLPHVRLEPHQRDLGAVPHGVPTAAVVGASPAPKRELPVAEVKAHEPTVFSAELDRRGANETSPVIDEPFDAGGEHHDITDDGTGVLVLSSKRAQAIAAIGALKGLNRRYRALPHTASRAQKKAIIDDMIVVLKANPNLIVSGPKPLGDPPNLGEITTHSAQTQRFLPKSGDPSYAQLWELESEHVIPRSYANALFAAFDLPKVTTTEYKGMHTLLIYKGAADRKTEGEGGDNSVYRELQWAAHELKGEVGKTVPQQRHRAAALLRRTINRLYKAYAGNARARTYEAIVEEHAAPLGSSTHGAIRGRPAAPPRARVDTAFNVQLLDTTEMLLRRVAGG